MVFIDANHSYEYVLADIIAWYPKIKIGGILCGHDYFDVDTPGRGHVGVTKAIKETIGDDFELTTGSCVWKHIKKAKCLL